METDNKKYREVMKRKENYPLKDFIALLIKEGYMRRNQEGSHITFKNEKTGTLISLKNEKIVSIGVLRKELQKVYPNWNVKDSQETTETKFELTESMYAIMIELELTVETLTQDDYDTLKELTK